MKKKKIVIIGSDDFFSIELMYLRAFKLLQNKAIIFNIYNIKKNLVEKIIWKFFKKLFFFYYRIKLINFFKENNSYDLAIIFKGIYLDEKTLKKIKNNCRKTIFANIFTDDPFYVDPSKDISNYNVVKSIKTYDYFFIWSKIIRQKIKKKLNYKNVFYLPFAYDEIIHKKQKNSFKVDFDISFIGTFDEERENTLKKLKNYKMIIGGLGWNKSNLKNSKKIKIIDKALNAKEMSKIYNNSKISLNILRKQNYGSHNMKTFEITSMSGLLLTKRSIEQEHFFPENKASLMYKDEKELLTKVKYILKNNQNIIKIKSNGYQYSKKHSYTSRAKYLLKEIFNGK